MGPDLQRGISPMVGPAASQPGGRGFDSRPAQVRFLTFFEMFWTFVGHVGDGLGSVLGWFGDGFGMVLGGTFRTHFGRTKKFSESAGSNFPGCIDG